MAPVVRQEVEILAQERWQQLCDSQLFEEKRWGRRDAHSPGNREYFLDYKTTEKCLERFAAMIVLDVIARLLEQRAVLDAARAGHFTRAASQA